MFMMGTCKDGCDGSRLVSFIWQRTASRLPRLPLLHTLASAITTIGDQIDYQNILLVSDVVH